MQYVLPTKSHDPFILSIPTSPYPSPISLTTRFPMQGDTYSFVIRIWHESVDQAGNVTAWRGYIDYVGASQRLYFQDLEAITQFIKEQTNLAPNPPARWWTKLKRRLSKWS